MKKILSITLSGFLLGMTLFAQNIDRTKAPKPGPAPTITIKDPVIYKLANGITVIVVENHKLPRVNATFSVDRIPFIEGSKVGVTELMGQMLAEGTTKTPKDKFDQTIDEMGANVNLFSSGGSTSALTRYFEKAFLMMAEALRYPAFPEASFEKIKSLKLTGLKSNEKSASAISARVVAALAYGKTSAQGEFETEESIKALTIDDIKNAYKENISSDRAYLTFVGDITPEAAKALATKAFGNWKGQKIQLDRIPYVLNPTETEIDFVDLPTAVQGEISVTNLVNNPMSNPDYHALKVANQILGGGAESKLFMNLREKHGFTYGSYSRIGSGRFQSQFSGGAQVRSEKADSAVAEIISEIKNMQDGKITEEELKNAKAKYNGSFALGMEDPERTASYASDILINNLPKDYYRTFLQKINAVTIQDVQRVSKTYFSKDNSRIIIVGNGSKILPNLTRLGYPIKQFDKFANPVVDKPKETNIKESDKSTESISAANLIESYLKAIGGKDEVAKLKTFKSNFSSEMMGQQFSGTDIRMSPNKRSLKIMMGSMTVMQQSFDGTKGYQAQMGQKKEMDEKEIKENQDDKGIIPQLYYISSDYQLSYLGTGKAGGEDCYKLKVTKPSGKVTVEYYSIKTGLLVREESTIEAGGNEMNISVDYSDYRKAGTMMFPYSITQTAGEQEFPMKVSDIILNEGVIDADFN